MGIRIFQPVPLAAGAKLQLDARASHHVAGVLRARRGDPLIVFNGQGGEYPAVITSTGHRQVEVTLGAHSPREAESPLRLHLGQGISRGEKMDFTLQKAVELGVSVVTPLITARCNVRLIKERFEKKRSHWRGIAEHACEQCGRNRIPDIREPVPVKQWLMQVTFQNAFVLDPAAQSSLRQLSSEKNVSEAVLLVGPEGGLDTEELTLARERQFMSLSLGPRILRTETAGLAAITLLQGLYGDM